jgi:predicted outer membrane repeat protein
VNLTDNATVNGNTAKTGGGVSAESGTLYMNGNRVTDLSPDKTTISKAVYGNDGFPKSF